MEFFHDGRPYERNNIHYACPIFLHVIIRVHKSFCPQLSLVRHAYVLMIRMIKRLGELNHVFWIRFDFLYMRMRFIGTRIKYGY